MTQQPTWIADLVRVVSTDERERLLHSRPTEGLPDDVRCLAQEVLRLIRIDLQQAEVIAEAAIYLADRQLDPFCHGLSRRALAHVRYLLASYEEALSLYAEAAESFRCSGAEVEVGKTLSNSLQVRILLGRYEEALAAAAEARRLFEAHGEELCLARLECNVGNLLHRQDRFKEAIECYQSCLQLFRQLGSDPQAIVAALLNSGVCRIALGEYDKALECFAELRPLCVEHDLPLPAAQADYNTAYLHYRRGDLTRAIELYRAAEKNCSDSGDAYHLALCHLDLAELYLELRRTKDGIRMATAANRSFSQLGLGYEASKALVFMALGASQEKHTKRSLELLLRAHRAFGREGNSVWCAMIDYYRGLIELDSGHALEARRHGETARAFFLDCGRTSRVAQCEILLARAEQVLGNTDQPHASGGSALEPMDLSDVGWFSDTGTFVSRSKRAKRPGSQVNASVSTAVGTSS